MLRWSRCLAYRARLSRSLKLWLLKPCRKATFCPTPPLTWVPWPSLTLLPLKPPLLKSLPVLPTLPSWNWLPPTPSLTPWRTSWLLTPLSWLTLLPTA